MSESKERRILEDEGFYVGIRPEVALRNKNKMENRLLAEPDHVRIEISCLVVLNTASGMC